MTKPKKKAFELEADEAISDCLNRMAKEGYQALKRIEKPYFKETNKGPVYAGQMIKFEGRLIENTND